MSNENLLRDDNQITDYPERARRMMFPYKNQDTRKFFLWLNEFEYVADIICVPDNKIIELFKNMINNDVHALVQEHFNHANVFELSYEEIINLYLRYFSTNHNKNLHWTRFNCRKQYEEEPIEKYAYSLQKIYNKCNYKNDINKRLRKQFIKGVRNNELREYLRENPCLRYDEVVEEAIEYAKVNLFTYYLDQALLMIHVYNPEKEGVFYNWFNKFEYVADILSVPDNQMIEFFKKMINNNVHTSVHELNPHINFSEHSYEDIINFYLRHFSPYEVNLHRARFICRKQYEEETIKKYADNLRKICYKCNYSLFSLEKELCKQFLCGVRDKDIINYLSKIPRLFFDVTVEKAIEYQKSDSITYYVDQALLKINIYDPQKEDNFNDWLNKFEYIADIISVPDNKMIIFFNIMVNNNVHSNVKQTFFFVNFFELLYEEIINFYLRYFYPKEIDLQRGRFICRKQYNEEPIEQYANSLQRLYNNSNYKSRFEEILCEQFLHGIRDEEIKTHLIKTLRLSFDEIMAEAIEFAKVNLITYYRDQALLKIHIYDPSKEGYFYAWLNKFEYIADLIKVPDNKMIEFFNNMMNNDIQEVIKQTLPTVDFSELSYEEIINLHLRYFSTRKEKYLHRTQFFCRKQYKDERIENYACSLLKLYNKCNYKTIADKALCVQFFNGLRENDKLKYLIKTSRLSFNETIIEAIEFAKVNLITYYRDQAILKIHIYNPRKEGNFYAWFNKFEYVADLIEVPNNKMIEFFYNMVIDDVHRNVKQTFSFLNFSELLYEEIINFYLRYFSPYEINLHRTRFICRKQYEEETIRKYADNLRKICYKCDYTLLYLEKELCKQFLCGIRDEEIKCNLSKTPILSFDVMVEKAIEFQKSDSITYNVDQATLMINT